APHGSRYVALSYVWGKAAHVHTTEADVKRDGSGREVMIVLPRLLPQTIEDAMHVTRSLGERYLWVDAFCIVQDNLADKHSQIIHMDAIYSSAFVTIVAASGSNSNSGLPGVSRPRNGHQVTEMIRDLRFAVPLPEYMSTVFDPDLVWNSRGWTYQEKI